MNKKELTPLLDGIKELALSKQVFTWDIYEELQNHLDDVERLVAIEEAVRENIDPNTFYFLDIKHVENIYFTQDNNDLIPDENGLVSLPCITGSDVYDVEYKNLRLLSLKDYKTLLRLFDWSDALDTLDGYEEAAKSIIEKTNREQEK